MNNIRNNIFKGTESNKKYFILLMVSLRIFKLLFNLFFSTPLLPGSALRSEMVKKTKEDPKAKKNKGISCSEYMNQRICLILTLRQIFTSYSRFQHQITFHFFFPIIWIPVESAYQQSLVLISRKVLCNNLRKVACPSICQFPYDFPMIT